MITVIVIVQLVLIRSVRRMVNQGRIGRNWETSMEQAVIETFSYENDRLFLATEEETLQDMLDRPTGENKKKLWHANKHNQAESNKYL